MSLPDDVLPRPPSSDAPDVPALPPPRGDEVPVLWHRDLSAAAAQTPKDWLWHGILAPGNLTLLTSQWKSGKTTLLAVLLDRLRTGGQLLGLPLRAGKALVVSEESPAHWHARGGKLTFGDHLGWICRPFAGKPTPEQWTALLAQLARLHERFRYDLLAIDPLACFLPGRDESHAALMLERLLPVQDLARRGPSVLLLHHPGKKEAAPGQAARGSGALIALADIVIEMHAYQRGAPDRRRRLHAWSRHDETPRQLVIELNAAGNDYLCHGDEAEDEFHASWQLLHAVLEAAPTKMTRRDILARWPDGARKPAENTLWRWLERVVAEQLVCREGSSEKGDAFLYWLPGLEQRWLKENPLYMFELMAREHNDRQAEERFRRQALERGRLPREGGIALS